MLGLNPRCVVVSCGSFPRQRTNLREQAPGLPGSRSARAPFPATRGAVACESCALRCELWAVRAVAAVVVVVVAVERVGAWARGLVGLWPCVMRGQMVGPFPTTASHHA